MKVFRDDGHYYADIYSILHYQRNSLIILKCQYNSPFSDEIQIIITFVLILISLFTKYILQGSVQVAKILPYVTEQRPWSCMQISQNTAPEFRKPIS